MKHVQVLKEILIIFNKGGGTERNELWSFYKYLTELVLVDPAMGTGYAYLKAGSIIQEKFKEAEVESWVELEEDYWKLISNSIINPKGSPVSFGMSLDILQQFLPFMKSIVEDYKEEKPKLENPTKWVD